MSEEDLKKHINGELNFGGFSQNQFADIKTSTLVTMYEQLVVYSEDGPQTLSVKIVADFDELPKKYHEIFLNVLTAKYLNKVSFGANPFSECKPVKKRKWYQFWKSKYFTA
jgi:hypothetical protein